MRTLAILGLVGSVVLVSGCWPEGHLGSTGGDQGGGGGEGGSGGAAGSSGGAGSGGAGCTPGCADASHAITCASGSPTTEACPSGICNAGEGKCAECDPAVSASCKDTVTVQSCDANGHTQFESCSGVNHVCDPTAGACAPGCGTAGKTTCNTAGSAYEVCQADGNWGADQACTGGPCVAGACGECSPGDERCGSGVPQYCDQTGHWQDKQCTPPSGGTVMCADAAKGGCAPSCGGGATVDTSTDPGNCGVCGHVCTGASTCSAGACVPASCATQGTGKTDCGAASESCCTSSAVQGGTVFREFASGTSYAATVSDFRLDKYEVTVGRFRQFVSWWLAHRPNALSAGAGKHAHLNQGGGLNGGSEPGWNATWNSQLVDTAAKFDSVLDCSGQGTWTAGNERLPINCVSWFEAAAFCIYDGGFLPTEAEWIYAAAGGALQRVYPWSSPPSSNNIDTSHAVYNAGGPQAVGSLPLGEGLFHQVDLVGNVDEWVLDHYDTSPLFGAAVDGCVDFANISSNATDKRANRGGPFWYQASDIRTDNDSGSRNGLTPDYRDHGSGFRCARVPSP